MLTPEDLRLLLNGTCQVDIELLKSITTFSDESRQLYNFCALILTYICL